jgi:hypothetical protein
MITWQSKYDSLTVLEIKAVMREMGIPCDDLADTGPHAKFYAVKRISRGTALAPNSTNA